MRAMHHAYEKGFANVICTNTKYVLAKDNLHEYIISASDEQAALNINMYLHIHTEPF